MTTSQERFAPGTFAPAPGSGRVARMLGVQALTETKLALRNGEQVLLTLLIPLALLLGLTLVTAIPMAQPRIATVAPRMLALAIMSSAFTGQAISLGFDRRYGVLRRLAATALPRWSIVGGRMLAALAVVVIQLIVLGFVAALLGWAPYARGVPAAVLLVVLGTFAFGALGLLLGGSVRAEVVLAVANLVWFVLLLAGGLAVTASGALATLVEWLPSGALAEGLHHALSSGGWPGWQPIGVLAGWALVAGGIATRTTRLV